MPSKVLFLAGCRSRAAEVGPLLAGSGVETEECEGLDEARQLVGRQPFALVVSPCALPDGNLETLLDLLRHPASPCRECAVLVLAEEGCESEVRGLLGRGVNRIERVDCRCDRLVDALADLLALAGQRRLRAAVQLEVRVWHHATHLLSVTRNVSASGMLVMGGRGIEPGTVVGFELTIPGEREPVCGEGAVSRRADRESERIEGFGVRFSRLDEDGAERLQSFLARSR